MSSESPASELYSSTGVELSVLNNTALPTTPYGLISVGSDGTNSRFIKVDTSGNTIIVGLGTAGTPSGGVVSVQGVSGGTAIPVSGTVAVTQSTSPWVDNITQFGGVNISTGTGASGTGIPRVTVSNDSNILATQSGTWTVQPGNTANTTPWLVTDSSDGSVAPGTVAGKSSLAGGQFNTALPTLTNTQQSAIQLDSSGRIIISSIPTGANVIGAVTQSGAPWSENITQFGGNNVVTGTGVSGVGIPRVTVSSDSNILATQSGSWTVTSNQGTANTTANAWPIKVTDGTNSAAVKASTTAAVAADPSLVIAFSPNSPLPTGTNSIGTVNQGTAATLANAWSQKLTDGTNGPVAVKAPSTAAVATDPALVVAISPNNSIGLTTNDITATGSLGALNAAVQLAVAGTRNAGMQLVAGSLVGTIVPEISMDGGTTWVTTFFDDPVTSNITSSITFGSSNTATTRTIVGSGGSSHVRIRVSVFTSGTATCNLRASTLLDPTTLYGGASGSALPPVVIQNGASVTTSAPTYTNATINALSLNTTGDLRVTGKITDGTNTAAVKAASTAPLATDPALVVTLSPNSVAQANATGSGTVNALNGNVVATTAGYGSTIFDITGSWVGTFTSQATNGDGSWINVASLSNQSGLITNTTTINGTLEMNAAGWTQARLIATAWTSGTATITWSSGQGNHVMIAYQGNGINLQTNTALVDSSQNFLGTTAASTSATASQQALVIQQSPIMPKATTATLTSVNSSTSSVSLLASNANRTGVIIVNDSTATLFVAFASTASTTAYTFRLTSDAVLELPNLPIYTGAISGISSSTNGAIRITELSP